MRSALVELRRHRTFILLLAAAAAVRLGAYSALRPVFDFVSTGAAHEAGPVDALATSLLATGVYGLTPGVPDAVLPPVYSTILAAVYRIAGRGALQVVLLNGALDLVTLTMVYRIGAHLFGGSRRVGLLAAACVAFYPYLVFQSLTVTDTSLFTAQVYVAVLLAFSLRQASESRRLWIGLALGVVLGLALLTRPVVVPLAALLGCWLVANLGARVAAVRLAPAVLAGVLVVGPWVARNSAVSGRFVAVSTNGGSNFWQGNNHETLDYLRAGYDVQWIPGPTLRTSTHRLGAEADAEFLQIALAHLRSHPTEIPALLLTKLRVQWSLDVSPRHNPATTPGPVDAIVASGDGDRLTLGGLSPASPIAAYSTPLFDRMGRTVHRWYWGSLWLAGGVGILLTIRRWRDVSLLWAVPVGLTLAYVLTHPSTRYRSPGDPAVLLFASAAIMRVAARWTAGRDDGGDAAARAGRASCCWMSGARYRHPLDPTDARKWQTLARLQVSLHVVGYSTSVWPATFTEHARFYALPLLPWTWGRLVVRAAVAPVVLFTVAVRHDVRVIVAQSPLEGAAAAVVKTVLGWFGRRVALVVESHGDFVQAPVLYRRAAATRLTRAAMRRASDFGIGRADLGRAVSDATRAQLAARAPGALRIDVFPAWIDTEIYASQSREAPPSISRELLFAGALAPVKGVHLLIDAFARLRRDVPDARLTIAGPVVDRSYSSGLHAQAAALGLDACVRFAGPQSTLELAALMARARLLVVPSLSEGLSRVALEAMLVGTPVLAARVGGLPEIVRPGETGYLVPAGDVDALADGLRRAFVDPDIDRLGEHAQTATRRAISVQAYLDGHRRLLTAAGLSPG